jgi:hypothetical protein
MRLTLRAVIGFFLAVLLALPVPGWSQSNLVAPGGGLKIVVIRGEGVVNSITSKGAPVVVEVRDDTDKPLAGADVVFQMPYMGPGGTFYGWMRTHSTRTDAEGRATSASFSPSSEEGPFEIVVTASAVGKHTAVRVAQSNSRTGATPAAKSSHKTLWIVLGVVAAGAIGGGVAASRRGGDSSAAVAAVPVTVTPGLVTVGGPR